MQNPFGCTHLHHLRFKPQRNMVHATEHKLLDTGNLQSKGWYAWIEYHSQRPHALHVVGTLEIPNPGIQLQLIEKISGNKNDDILSLSLLMRQESGEWPDVACWYQVSFFKSLIGSLYQMVHIHSDMGIMEKIPVEVVM